MSRKQENNHEKIKNIETLVCRKREVHGEFIKNCTKKYYARVSTVPNLAKLFGSLHPFECSAWMYLVFGFT